MTKNIRYNAKKMASLLGLSLALTLTGCSRDATTTKDLYIESQDLTTFDEIISEETIEEVDRLIDYINISNTLHGIKFERKATPNIEESYTLATIEEIKDYIKDKEYDLLNVQEQLVNRYIYSRGYDLIAYVSENLLKAKELDVLEFDATAVDHVNINDSKEAGLNNPERRYIDLGTFKVSDNNSLGKLYRSMYEMKIKGYKTATKEATYQYNKDRNNMILKAIKAVREVIPTEYKIGNNGVLKAK